VRWRVLIYPIGHSGESLALLASLDHLDAAIAGFRSLVAEFTVVAAVITFLAGWLLAGRALRPVSTLRATAQGIALSRDFGRRVPGAADRDELGQLAATFNSMLATLEQAYQAQQRFVADASHELRAPLTAIQPPAAKCRNRTSSSLPSLVFVNRGCGRYRTSPHYQRHHRHACQSSEQESSVRHPAGHQHDGDYQHRDAADDHHQAVAAVTAMSIGLLAVGLGVLVVVHDGSHRPTPLLSWEARMRLGGFERWSPRSAYPLPHSVRWHPEPTLSRT
jgi:signal transduction histidine kinase